MDLDAFPHLRSLFRAGAERESFLRMIRMTLDPGRFERGLDLLLDRIERRVGAAGAKAPPGRE